MPLASSALTIDVLGCLDTLLFLHQPKDGVSAELESLLPRYEKGGEADQDGPAAGVLVFVYDDDGFASRLGGWTASKDDRICA